MFEGESACDDFTAGVVFTGLLLKAGLFQFDLGVDLVALEFELLEVRETGGLRRVVGHGESPGGKFWIDHAEE